VKANEHCATLAPTQIQTLKTFFTTAERNLGATATRYGELALIRTCYEEDTDAAFGHILFKYRDAKFASVFDDKGRYACDGLKQSAMRCLPFLIETTRFVRCSLMPKERQDKILRLSRSINCLRDNKVEVDRLLLMDDTHSAFRTLTELSLPDLQRWSSIVGVICLVDYKAMDCGLIKLCAFDDQGQPIWCSRISPEGLLNFMAGMERGESVWELRLALRQYESGSGRRYSAYELSTNEVKPSPSSAYDTLRMIAKRDQAEQQRPDQDGEKQNTLTTTLASDQEIPVEELDVKIYEDSNTMANEMVGYCAESEIETHRELKQKLEKLVADKERAETESVVIMRANEDLHNKVKMLSEEKRMAEEARDEAMLEKDQAMMEKDKAIRDAEQAEEYAELKYEKFTDQQHNELSKVHIVLQDTTQKIKYAHSFYRNLISRLGEELAAAQKAQQGTSKGQELEKAAHEDAMDRLQKGLLEAVEASHEVVFMKERADGARRDKIRQLNTELQESTKAKQDITAELDRAVNREEQALGEETRTEEARAMAYVSEESSYNARLTTEADLQATTQMVEQLKVDLAGKLEEDRAEYAKKLSECVAAKDLAVDQKEAAVLHKLILGEELARERDRVAEMQKMLEAKNRKIIEANDFENRITQRLREEIMAKEKAMNAEDMLASQWGQALADNGREISDLREQLMTGRSACTRASEQNELLTRKLAQEVTTNEELKREIKALESEWQEMKQKLSAEEEESKEFEVALGSLEEKMRTEVDSKQQIIDRLNNANQELKAQQWEFATRLSKEIANKDQVMREKVELLEQLREGEKKINASHEYAASMAAREAKTSKELELKNQTIKHSEGFISMLKAEIGSASEACLSYKAQLAAADQGCGVAKDARIQVEKDLQSQNIRHIEEMKQAQHAIKQASKAKEEAIKQAKSIKEDLEEKLSGEITLKTKLEEDLKLVGVHLASSRERCYDIGKEYTRECYRSALLQQALEQQNPQVRDEEEVGVRAQLERQCQVLTEELAEAREAKAKLEMENKEDRIRMAALLGSADITAQKERMKCERAEEELRVWRDQDGVIAFD
jgi:hypothetical protein